MYKEIDDLLDNMRELQEQMEAVFSGARKRFHYSIEGKRVRVISGGQSARVAH